MSLLGLGVLLVVGLGLVLFIVLVFTRGIFARDLTQALQRVTQQEQTLQEQANLLEQRIAQMEREYHAKLKHAEAESARILEEAKTHAMNIRTVAVEEAKHLARQLLLEAEHGKAQLRFDVAKELNGQAIQRTCATLQAIVPARELAVLHEGLVKELLETLKQADATPWKGHVEQIAVTTAHPFSAEQSQRLTQWVATTLGATVRVDVEVDPALIAGCVVQIGESLIDNSMPSRLGQHERIHGRGRR